MQVAHSKRDCSIPSAWGVDGTSSIQAEIFDLSREITWQQQEFVERLRNNVYGRQMGLRVQRSFCFAECSRTGYLATADAAIKGDGESLRVNMRRIKAENVNLLLFA